MYTEAEYYQVFKVEKHFQKMATLDSSMLVIIAVCTAIVYWFWDATKSVVQFLKGTYRSTRALKKFPSENHHWFFGHILVHPGATEEGMMTNYRWMTNNPRCYVVYMGPVRPVLILHHPETVKILLKTAEPKALLGGSGYTLLRPWLGDGLLVSSGAKWFRNRRLLTPAFHFDVLKPYMSIYNQCVEGLMQKFDQLSAKTGNSLDIFNSVSLCTLDIILRCAFSATKNVQQQGSKEPYVNTVTSLAKCLVSRGMNPLLHSDFIYYKTQRGKRFIDLCAHSHLVAESVMRERREELASNPDCRKEKGKYIDFLDILLLAQDEAGEGLTDAEIRDEVETFMFEGHDTTSSGIAWILYNLARHPDIQSKARAEVDAILDSEGHHDNALLWDDMSQLPYLTRCIKESLRLHPPVHLISRQTTKETIIDGKTIPANTLITINIFNLHRNPTVWTDPLSYDPDRFLPENMATMDSFAFAPFSAGPRNCIGQVFAMNEMKASVARILRSFEFELDVAKPPRMLPDVVLRAEGGMHLRFKKRGLS